MMAYSTLKPSTKPMKRTAFKVKPLSGLLRTANLASPLKWPTLPKPRKARMKSKQRVILDVPQIFRSEWMLAFVRQLPCMCCGARSLTEAAHSNQIRFGKGRGIKASDAAIMALCKSIPGRVGCHANHDQGGKLNKQEWKEFEYQMIAKTILELIKRAALTPAEGLIESLPQVNEICESLAIALVAHIENGRIQVAR